MKSLLFLLLGVIASTLAATTKSVTRERNAHLRSEARAAVEWPYAWRSYNIAYANPVLEGQWRFQVEGERLVARPGASDGAHVLLEYKILDKEPEGVWLPASAELRFTTTTFTVVADRDAHDASNADRSPQDTSVDCNRSFNTANLVSWGIAGSTACWVGAAGGDQSCSVSREDENCSYTIDATTGTIYTYTDACGEDLEVELKSSGSTLVITGGETCTESTS